MLTINCTQRMNAGIKAQLVENGVYVDWVKERRKYK